MSREESGIPADATSVAKLAGRREEHRLNFLMVGYLEVTRVLDLHGRPADSIQSPMQQAMLDWIQKLDKPLVVQFPELQMLI